MTDGFRGDAPPAAGVLPSDAMARGQAPIPSGGLQDNAAGCRARADAELGQLAVPGREEDRCRHALSAVGWLSRAERLDRVEPYPGPKPDRTRS